MKRRGFWLFDMNNCNEQTIVKSSIQHILLILINSEMFIPEKCVFEQNVEKVAIPEGLSFEKLVDFIFEINPSYILGRTKIYGREKMFKENVFNFGFEFRYPGFGVFLNINSDIFLPMTFNENTYSFNWNLEYHNLNYERLPKMFKEIQKSLNWDDDCSKETDYTERGCIQVGYDLFLSPEIIKREYLEQPNFNFDLEGYLKKINNSLSFINK